MLQPPPRYYTLPSSPSYRCLDRFSILDETHEDGDGLVGVWPLLLEVLSQPVSRTAQVISMLETIACSLRGTSGVAGDYGTLKTFLDAQPPSFYASVWPSIVDSALRLPTLFLDSQIAVLTPGSEAVLERDQVRCLVAHQFLCTLEEPPWRDGFYDFSIWYASDQRHPRAAEMYLAALIEFFSHPPFADEPVRYSLSSFEKMNQGRESPNDAALVPVEIIRLPTFSTQQQELSYQGPHGAVVVSANKHIGFGQSATQEEIYVGNAPDSCPAVLMTPPLSDEEVLMIQGAAPMLRIDGQRRDISWTPLPGGSRCGGRMLFMDALEMDERGSDGGRLPDLRPENMDRELRKAIVAFSSWQGDIRTVSTGLWGCGAFNGNPGVKMKLVWAAASIAGVNLEIMCDGRTQREFADVFEDFVRGMTGAKVRDLMEAIERLQGDEHLLQITTLPCT